MTPDPNTVVYNRIANHLDDAFKEIVATLGDDLDSGLVRDLAYWDWGSGVMHAWDAFARELNIKEGACSTS